MKNKTIFFKKWPSTGRLDAHLAKNLWGDVAQKNKVVLLSSLPSFPCLSPFKNDMKPLFTCKLSAPDKRSFSQRT